MSSVSNEKKRTITIDPNFQSSLSKKTARRGNRNRNSAAIKPRPFIRPNTLKKSLLDKIKQHQQRQQQQRSNANANAHTNANANNTTDESADGGDDANKFAQSFQDSLSYLQTLSDNKKTAKRKDRGRSAVKQVAESSSLLQPEVNVDLSPAFSPPASFSATPPMLTMTNLPAATSSQHQPQIQHQPQLVSSELFEPQVPMQVQVPPIYLGPDPKWGCLKNGTKPTFRTLAATSFAAPINNSKSTYNENRIQLSITEMPDVPNTTGAPSNDGSPIIRAEMNEIAEATNNAIETTYGARKQRLDEYRREHFEDALKNQQPVIKIRETKQHVITKKYKLGKYTNKNGPVIGVLIKNRQTQHNIEKKRNEMRHIPLHTIKARLHKKNLLKVGSIAPPDILRELYENAVFAGDIENDGEGILLHNFLSSSSSFTDGNAADDNHK